MKIFQLLFCSAFVSFPKGLPGALPAHLPELSLPQWAQGPHLIHPVPQTGSVTLAGLCFPAGCAQQQIIFLYFLQCNVKINQVRTVAAGGAWEPTPSRGSAPELGQIIRSFIQINSQCLPPTLQLPCGRHPDLQIPMPWVCSPCWRARGNPHW